MHKNNFDFLRLIFAVFVMISHANQIAEQESADFLAALTNDQLRLSYIGVRGFFVLSGFLIFQSLDRSRDIIDYYWKRILRLFPALIVVLVLTVLLGQFVYEGLVPYWSNAEVLSYIPNNLTLFRLQRSISGIFEHNGYTKEINSPLWTISYEFTMYMLLSGLLIFRKWKALQVALLISAILAFGIATVAFPATMQQYAFFVNALFLVELGTFFLIGSLLAAIKFENFKYRFVLAILAILVLAVATSFGIALKGFQFFSIALPVIAFGYASTYGINSIGKRIGDLSYGIYIFGFPVQQTLQYYFDPSPIILMITSILITMVLAWLSWHLLEKHALKLKKYHFLSWLKKRFAA